MTWCSRRGSPRIPAGESSPGHGDARGLELGGQAIRGHSGQRRQVARAPRQLQAGGVGRGQVLQVGDHARQSQHLIAQRGQLVRGGLGEPVQQCLVPGLQHRNRCAQLMRHVGDQIAAQLLLTVHSVGHLVERGGQFAQLAGAGYLADPGGALPTAHRPGNRDELLDRAGDPPGHGEPGQHGRQRRQPGRTRDGPQQRDFQGPVGAAQAGPVNRTTASPARSPRTTIGSRVGWLAAARRSRATMRPRGRTGPGSGYPRQPSRPGQALATGWQLASSRCGPSRAGGHAIALVLRMLPGGQGRDVCSHERRGQPGEERNRGKGDRDERQCQPQAKGTTARGGLRAAISHRGLGPAGIRHPSRSARSPGCARPAQPCDAGS